MLLVLLWTWAACVFMTLDLFLNVSEFEAVRPRATIYRAMRYAGHRLVGEPYLENDEFARAETAARGARSSMRTVDPVQPGHSVGRDNVEVALYGFYDLAEITVTDRGCRVYLAVQLVNESDLDLADVKISIEDPFWPERFYGPLTARTVGAGDPASLRGEFAVSPEAARHWQEGAAPDLHVEFQHGGGAPARRRLPAAFTILGREK